MPLDPNDLNDIPDHMPYIDAGFFTRLPCFAYDQFLKHGMGAIFIIEPPDIDYNKELVEDYMDYVPLELETVHRFPTKALNYVNDYNPREEVVLVEKNKGGKVKVYKFDKRTLPITPREAYRKWNQANGGGKYLYGDVLLLKKSIGAVTEGHYMFVGKKGAMMKLDKVTGERGIYWFKWHTSISLHYDFEDCFRLVKGTVYTAK